MSASKLKKDHRDRRNPKPTKIPLKRDVALRFKLGDEIKTYRILNPPKENSKIVKPLGAGGAGIVFLAEQTLHKNIRIKRAIKFFMYREDIAELTFHEKSAGISNKDFLNEIVNISGFSHENLVKVTDAGLYTVRNHNIPYIVTDFVEGPTLQHVIDCIHKREHRTDALSLYDAIQNNPSDILRILIEISAALKMLHKQNFLHCDIAPKNIFLNRHENFKVVIGDLGAGRILKTKGKCRVIGTKAYTPPELEPLLYKIIENKQLKEQFFPRWDLFAFAKTGLELMELLPRNSDLPWVSPLRATLEECRDGTNYKSIGELFERIKWLLSVNRSASDVPELSPSLLTKTRRLMPVEPLATTDRVRNLTWHPALLRLANVPQLVAAPHIFPGAAHSRYEHSLGTMETMRRYLMNLVGKNDFQEHLSSSKIETALLCALFSSLTRFPFSTVFQEIRGLPEDLLQPFSKPALLEEIFSIKDSNNKTLSDLVHDYFPTVDIHCVTNILAGNKTTFTKEDELIYSLLNCSLDVRVIDFVRRDSLHLGLSRQTFDLDELLAHLKIHHHRLALSITGVSTAEEIITLRYTLFNRIYWNRPNRAFIAMVRYVLISLASKKVIEVLRKNILKLTPREVLDVLHDEAYNADRGDLINLIEILLDDGRRQFQVILEASPKEDSELSVVCQRIREMDHLEMQRLAESLSESISDCFPGGTEFFPRTLNNNQRHVPLLIDIPSEPGSGNKLGDDILVLYPKQDTKTAENLSHASAIIKGVNDSFGEYLCRMRVLLHPDIYPVEKNQRITIRNRIKDYLLRAVQ